MPNEWSELHADAKSVYEFRLAAVELKAEKLETKYDQILGRLSGLLISIVVGTFSIIGTIVASHLLPK